MFRILQFISIDKPTINNVDGSGYKVIDYTKGVGVEDNKGFGGIGRGCVGIEQKPCWIPIYESDNPYRGAYGGFQPKPAVEVIIVCMKPTTEKTYASQALINRHGVTYMDDCRIPQAESIGLENNSQGRFPANILVGDDIMGDYSKYFNLDRWAVENGIAEDENTFPLLICPKASKREKEILPAHNSHPTVKPVKLMSYLITLAQPRKRHYS